MQFTNALIWATIPVNVTPEAGKMNVATASPVELLAELKAERGKFTESDKAKMQILVDRLVELGVYPQSTPTMEKYGYTHLKMVEGWGEDWANWREPLNCPHCDHDLRDHDCGPPFKKEIGIYRNDMTICWLCPFCGKAFNRFGRENGDLHLSDGQLDVISEEYRLAREKQDERNGL